VCLWPCSVRGTGWAIGLSEAHGEQRHGVGCRVARWKAQQGGTGWAIELHVGRHSKEARGGL